MEVLESLTLRQMKSTLQSPKLDYAYILRVAEQNKTGKFYKFFSYNKEDDYFKLGNIKVKHG